MTDRLAGKVALVTGAGSGIGRAAATRFAAEGATVGVLDVSADAAADTAALIEKEGGVARALVADVARAEQIEAAVDELVAAHGALHVLYNNAGVSSTGSVAVAEEADWDRAFDVNVKGTFLCSRAALRHLGEGAAIVNQGSVSALVGIPNFAAYCAAKGAVVNLTRQLAVDFAAERINVNAVCPGFLATAMVRPFLDDPELNQVLHAKSPWPELGTAQDVAKATLFLASDDARWATGTLLTVDGGFTSP